MQDLAAISAIHRLEFLTDVFCHVDSGYSTPLRAKKILRGLVVLPLLLVVEWEAVINYV